MQGRRFLAYLFVGVVVLHVGSESGAAPVLRVQVDQRGDFVLFGNTLARDCAPGAPLPVVGTVGDCGMTVDDSAPDVYWRSDDPAPGQATANTSITAANARSTAVLRLPAQARVTYARIYWAAQLPMGETSADEQIELTRPGVVQMAVNADASLTVAKPGVAGVIWYQSTADITETVQSLGPGPYRISGVNAPALADLASADPVAAWSVVVFYQLDSDPPRNLTLFDGLDLVNIDNPAAATLSGFIVPDTGFDAKLGVVAYEGDHTITGDSLRFKGTPLGDAQNPMSNFFNSSRSFLGSAVSVAGDLPQPTGLPFSMSGVDIDVVDVTNLLRPAETSATIEAVSSGDTYLLGVFVTSISTLKPDFGGTLKTATDLNGDVVRPGDEIEYTISVINTGDDTAVDTVLRDTLPAGVTYVRGSIEIVSGPNAGAKTDVTGDDQGEYLDAQRTVVVRLGTGADATQGGRLAPNETTIVRFRVTIDAGAQGSILNQAFIRAAGERGAPPSDFPSDADPLAPGAQPTPIPVDGCSSNDDCVAPKPICDINGTPPVCVACTNNSHCSGLTPVCDLDTKTCVPCAADADCTNPARPACNTRGTLAGACTECSETNSSRCGGVRPQCILDLGVCGCDSADGDSECGGSTSGVVCSGPAGICVAGCSLAPGRNGCPASLQCSDQNGGVGVCIEVGCTGDGDCTTDPLRRCLVEGDSSMCVQCILDSHCSDDLVCENPGRRVCVECTPAKLQNCSSEGAGATCLATGTCGCKDDGDCGGAASGRVCDPSTQQCTFGCRGRGGNACPPGLECTSTTEDIGRCIPIGSLCRGPEDNGATCGDEGICVNGRCLAVRFSGGGCTCSESGGVPAFGLALLLGALVMLWRRRRRS